MAGNYLLERRRKTIGKASFNESTVTRESSRIIVRGLRKLPGARDIPVYPESNAKQEFRWIVDRIDGTWNYLHNDFLWGVSIALAEDVTTQLGVIYLPSFPYLVASTRKGKIFCIGEGVKPAIRKDTDLSKATICMDWDKKGDLAPELFAAIGRMGVRTQVRQCAIASLLAVAIGTFTASIAPGPSPDDIAAGCLLVEKAGGRVTDYRGNPWSPFSKNIVASNDLLHNQILHNLPK